MHIKPYPESKIRRAIISKIDPKIKKGRSKHQKGEIRVQELLELVVKLPNNHSKEMQHSKSSKIAGSLKLNPEEFMRLIDCPMSGSDYYALITKRASDSA